jgi:heme-degrading monooxygenase HmoA
MSISRDTDREGTGAFVYLLHLVVEESRVDEVVEDVCKTSLPVLSRINGFRSLAVLVSDDRSHIVALSKWERRKDWARAEWDQQLQDAVVNLYRSALQFDPRSYHEVFRYPSGIARWRTTGVRNRSRSRRSPRTG